MQNYYHTFHIPVMGTGHSADTPIRVAPFGITSVISIIDDILLEKNQKILLQRVFNGIQQDSKKCRAWQG